MSYCQFNRKKVLQKAKENYSKEKQAKYYFKNQEAIKKKVKELIQKLVSLILNIKEKDISN